MKYKIVVTPRELMDNCKWGDYCEMTRTNEWAANEGLMDSDEEITLTYEQAVELGIVHDSTENDRR